VADRTHESTVRIVALAPDLLGTYGDAGNVLVLAQRLRWRGYAVEVVESVGAQVPSAGDVYVLGGGEDGPQVLAANELIASNAIGRAAENGAVVFGVCAGYQLLGRRFPDGTGNARDGLGLLDCETVRDGRPRRVGEIVVDTGGLLAAPMLTGFENHASITELGEGAQPLGRIVGGHEHRASSDGAVSGHVLATYLHGPVLARNPALADLLLSWVVGPLESIDDTEVDALRAERLKAVGARPTTNMRHFGRFTRAK
jgi:CobQ-like glutamine amidotransferase family enzyme